MLAWLAQLIDFLWFLRVCEILFIAKFCEFFGLSNYLCLLWQTPWPFAQRNEIMNLLWDFRLQLFQLKSAKLDNVILSNLFKTAFVDVTLARVYHNSVDKMIPIGDLHLYGAVLGVIFHLDDLERKLFVHHRIEAYFANSILCQVCKICGLHF